jgi:molybdate transport system ATP-binding protein
MRAVQLRAQLKGQAGALQLELELQVADGPLVVVGPNGAGKTSLLLLLLGALQPESGRISLGERVLFDSQAGIDVPLEGRQLGYLPQDYALFPHLDVRQNIRFALQSSGLRSTELETRTRTALADLLLEPLAERRVTTLSGGEKQRVALARALSVRPRALLLDEPLAAFDIAARRTTREFLAGYLERLALPTIVVTHDAADAQALGRQIAVLEAGRIVQSGSWAELEAHPATSFVREFLRA